MKGSSNKERSEFEESWRKAFDQAHMEPGIRVWENIDARLTNAENNKFKRRIVWYKWVAAASIVIGLGLSYVAIDKVYFNDPGRLTAVEGRENPGNTTAVNPTQGNEERNRQSDTREPGKKGKLVKPVEKDSPRLAENNPAPQNRQEEKAGDKALKERERVATSGGPASASKAEAYEQGSKQLEVDRESGDKGLKGPKESREVYENSAERALAKQSHPVKDPDDDDAGSSQIAGNTPSGNGQEDPSEKDALVPMLKKEGPQLTNQPTIAKAALVSIAEGEEEIQRTLVAGNVDKVAGLGYDLTYHAGLYEMDHMYKIPGILPLTQKEDEKEKSYDSFFAGVSFSSGVFDPNFSDGNTEVPEAPMSLPIVSAEGNQTGKIVSPFLTDSYNELANSNEKAEPAFSYAYGINVGKRLSERWVIQGGIKYGKYSSSTSSSAYVQDPLDNKLYPLHLVSNAETSYQSNRRITATRDYELKNNFEFISIPLEAGYIVIDKKIDVLISAGVGTRIFLKNNLEDQSNLFEDVKVTPGADSPYKDLFFNGLLGAEVSYQFGGHYTISLAPSYSMALSSFTKSETVFTSNPKSLSMSLGLRYFF